MKVGIPKGLLYYEYFPLWVNFFENLGVEVVLSNDTNKRILNQGTNNTVDDACIPVKIFHGHVLDLIGKVDYVFVPRIVGVEKKEYICPKFNGLPEMVKYSLKNDFKMIDTRIDLTKRNDIDKTFIEIGNYFTSDKSLIRDSYKMALNYYQEKLFYNKIELNKKDKPVILLLGHPYILHDDFLNMNIKKKLDYNEFDVLTPEMLDEAEITKYAKTYSCKLYWLFFRRLIGSILYLLEKNILSGVIYLSSFGCGIDSVVAETVERQIRRKSVVPFMLVTLDEHSGEAGFNTRLEAFMDMLKWRN